jgi:hypothetical protein
MNSLSEIGEGKGGDPYGIGKAARLSIAGRETIRQHIQEDEALVASMRSQIPSRVQQKLREQNAG